MLAPLLIALALAAVTVTVHAVGLALLFPVFARIDDAGPRRFWPTAWRLIGVTWILSAMHLAEIVIWALFYLWSGSMPTVEAALYFSGATYTTIGYGDLLLPEPWRLLAPLEGLVGILMAGLSTGFFFAVVSKVFGAGGRSTG